MFTLYVEIAAIKERVNLTGDSTPLPFHISLGLPIVPMPFLLVAHRDPCWFNAVYFANNVGNFILCEMLKIILREVRFNPARSD